ncbi:unnamed protein product, partial [Pelagomonas calceolata]
KQNTIRGTERQTARSAGDVGGRGAPRTPPASRVPPAAPSRARTPVLARVVEGVVAAQALLLATPPHAFQAVHVRAGLVERERRRAVRGNEPLEEVVGPAVGVEGVDEVQQRAVRADDGRRPLARAPVLAAAGAELADHRLAVRDQGVAEVVLLGEFAVVVGRVHRAAGYFITGGLELRPQALEVLALARSAAGTRLRVEPEDQALRARRRRERDLLAIIVFSDKGRRGVAAA